MPNKQINTPIYKTKPMPAPMRDFLKRYYPGTDPSDVRLHGWSPLGLLNTSVTLGDDVFLAKRHIYKKPQNHPKHLFHEFTHKRQWDAGTLKAHEYLADLLRRGYKNIPVEMEAEAHSNTLWNVFSNSPEGRQLKATMSRSGRR